MPNHEESPITSHDEAHERDLNRHRRDEERSARRELTDRLADRGITVADTDGDEAVVELWEAVEAFEQSVEARGGDLMVDTPPSHEPDDPRFVMPRRESSESLAGYTARIRESAVQLRAPRAD
jgi:hypothetical protein